MTPPKTFAGFSEEDALRQLEAERIAAEKATAEHKRQEAEKTAAEKKRLEDLARGNAEGSKTVLPGTAGFTIQELTDFYRIDGIRYCGNNNGLHSNFLYDLCKAPLAPKTQQEHIEHASNATPDEFRACNAPLVYAICKALYENKDGLYHACIENARQRLDSIFQTSVSTLSSVVYNSTLAPDANSAIMEDLVTHYHEKSPQRSVSKLCGPNGPITDPKTDAYQYVWSLLDTADTMKEVNDVFKWITGKDVYAFRYNDRPVEQVKTGVFFYGDINTNLHLTTLSPEFVDSAIGVSRVQRGTAVPESARDDRTFAGFDLDEVVRKADEAKRQQQADARRKAEMEERYHSAQGGVV